MAHKKYHALSNSLKFMHSITKPLIKLATLLTLLFATWFIYAVAVNWRDVAPSATALAFEAYYHEHVPRHVEKNAYAFLFGFDVPEDQDPLAWGEKRIEWTHETQYLPGQEWDFELPGDTAEFFGDPPIGAKLLNSACRFGNPECLTQLRSAQHDTEKAIQRGRWTIDRYKQLLEHDIFVENTYLDTRMILPSYQHLLTTQHLYYADLILHQESLGPDFIRQAVEKDLVFWRLAQQDSVNLITKMISVAAIQNNFGWTNVLLQLLPPEEKFSIKSTSYDLPMNQDELSVEKVLVGEWIFGSRHTVKAEDYKHLCGSWCYWLGNLFYQEQATKNLLAEQHATIVGHFGIPLEAYPEALQSAERIAPKNSRVDALIKPANAVGRALLSLYYPAYGEYVVRVSDLEGQRRALVLISQIRQRQLPVDQVPKAIAVSDIRNPYTDEPFEWDAEMQAIVFTGLQSTERRRQVYKY